MGKDVAIYAAHYSIHTQYTIHILYNPGFKLYIADWLYHHNDKENKDAQSRNVYRKIMMLNLLYFR